MEESLKKIILDILNIYTNKMKGTNAVCNLISKEQLCDFYYLKVKSLLYEIIFILLTYFKVDKDTSITIKSQKYIDRFKKITEYIENNYKETLVLADVANYYGLSREHLARCFKKLTKIQYIKFRKGLAVLNSQPFKLVFKHLLQVN